MEENKYADEKSEAELKWQEESREAINELNDIANREGILSDEYKSF